MLCPSQIAIDHRRHSALAIHALLPRQTPRHGNGPHVRLPQENRCAKPHTKRTCLSREGVCEQRTQPAFTTSFLFAPDEDSFEQKQKMLQIPQLSAFSATSLTSAAIIDRFRGDLLASHLGHDSTLQPEAAGSGYQVVEAQQMC